MDVKGTRQSLVLTLYRNVPDLEKGNAWLFMPYK